MGKPDSITAVILAGGSGTRLRSVVADRPKVLAEVQGRPFLAFLLDQVASAGARYVVLCTGYRGEQVRDMFGDTCGDMNLAYSHEPEPLGTAGALRLALPFMKSDPVLVMNGDSFCETDLAGFWGWHRTHGASASLLLTSMPDTQRYGRVKVDEEARVMGFDEKGQECGPGWISAGVYVIERRLIRTIPANRPASLEQDVFPAWIGRGLYGCRSQGRFIDIGTPEAYASAGQFSFQAPGNASSRDRRIRIGTTQFRRGANARRE